MNGAFQDVSESLHAAAARSLFATVIYLVEQKKVEAMDGLISTVDTSDMID